MFRWKFARGRLDSGHRVTSQSCMCTNRTMWESAKFISSLDWICGKKGREMGTKSSNIAILVSSLRLTNVCQIGASALILSFGARVCYRIWFASVDLSKKQSHGHLGASCSCFFVNNKWCLVIQSVVAFKKTIYTFWIFDTSNHSVFYFWSRRSKHLTTMESKKNKPKEKRRWVSYVTLSWFIYLSHTLDLSLSRDTVWLPSDRDDSVWSTWHFFVGFRNLLLIIPESFTRCIVIASLQMLVSSYLNLNSRDTLLITLFAWQFVFDRIFHYAGLLFVSSSVPMPFGRI